MTAQLAPNRRRRSQGSVSLRPLSMDDAVRVRRWMADPAVIRFTVVVPGPEYGERQPYAPVEADQYLETLVLDPQRRSFAIEWDGAHVGNVGLKDYVAGSTEAECFIELGERSARGRGVGSRAMSLLLERAFSEWGLERIRLGVFEFNAPAIRLYRALGFEDDGPYGQHFADGRFWCVNAMVLQRSRWRASRGHAP